MDEAEIRRRLGLDETELRHLLEDNKALFAYNDARRETANLDELAALINLIKMSMDRLPQCKRARSSSPAPAPDASNPQHSRLWVYAIGPVGGGLTKIGHAANVRRRLDTIQRMSPVPLMVLWTMRGGRDVEGRLHVAFAAERRQGEWFDLGPDPVRAIMEVLG